MKKLFSILFLSLALSVCAKETDNTQTPFLSLTDSQDAGLEMTNLSIRTVLDGISAFTEIEMHFYNPQDRIIEGKFQIQLPQNASISRFAMEINNKWMEGEIVERQKARRVFEDFLHRKQDPALLESDSGNMFNARVFPIPGKSTKKLIVSYSELLVNNNDKYIIPLASLPKIKDLSVKVMYKEKEKSSSGFLSSLGGSKATNWKVMSLEQKDYQPKEDYVLSLPAIEGKEAIALEAGEVLAVKFKPYEFAAEAQKENYKNWVVLVDASYSQSPEFAANIKKVEAALAGSKATLYYFSQDIKKIESFAKLKDITPLGASNFEEAFKILNDDVKTAGSRLLIVSDGVPTAGETDDAALKNLLAKNKNIERVDALSLTSYKNEKFLREIVLAGKNTGVVLNKDMDEKQMSKKLLQPTVKEITFNVTNTNWFWPMKAEGVQKDDEVVVFAEVKDGKKAELTVAGKTLSYKADSADKNLIRREWVRARIEKLLNTEKTTEDKDLKEAVRKQIISVSEKERVLSPYTSMLVLETEWDYQRYNIDRNALADIMTVGADGIVMLHRKGEDLAQALGNTRSADIKEEAPRSGMLNKLKSMSIGRSVGEDMAFESAAMPMADMEMARSDEAPTSSIRGFSGGASAASRADSATERSRSSSSTQSVSREVTVTETVVSSAPSAARRPEIIEDRRAPVPVMRRPDTPRTFTPKKEELPKTDPYEGKFKEFNDLLEKGRITESRNFALKWIKDEPANVLAFVALGDADAARRDVTNAALAYGAIIDMYPGRVDMRRFAAQKLMTLDSKPALALAIDSLEKAKLDRQDFQTTYLLLSVAYLQNDQKEKAISVLLEALENSTTFQRNNSKDVFVEQIALIINSMSKAQQEKDSVKAVIDKLKIDLTMKPQMRFLLTWETDANDVDLHVYDKYKDHSFYSHMGLASGGKLYQDIRNGYGPECFAVDNPKAMPYNVYANYYSMGPMGYGMGAVSVVRFKDKSLSVELVPFVIMKGSSYVKITEVKKF